MRLFRYSNAFFNKLPIRIGLVVWICMFISGLAISIGISVTMRNSLREDALVNITSDAQSVVNIINNQVLHRQEIISRGRDEISKLINTHQNEEEINKYIKYFFDGNDWAVVAKLAYLPDRSPDGSEYRAYIADLDSNNNYRIEKYCNEEDYATWDWFKAALTSRENKWSASFFNRTKNIIVYSYTCPIFDEQTQEMIAIWAVDMKFLQLTEILSAFQPTHTMASCVISKEGRYIYHPNQDYYLLKYDQIEEKYKTPEEKKIYDLARTKETGSTIIKIKGEKKLILYRPIRTLEASMVLSCSLTELFAKSEKIVQGLWNWLNIAIIIISILVSVIIAITLRPITDLSKAVANVSKGDFTTILPELKHNDELKSIKNVIERMQNTLKDNMNKLIASTAEVERINEELDIARKIQESFISSSFSPFPENKGLSLYASLKPADYVGGDLYDFFIRDNKLFVVVGDVTGSGVPASLCMAIASKLFRSVAFQEDSPAVIANRLNHAFAENNPQNMFVTMFVGVLDLQTSEFCYTNAGHNPPIIMSKKSCYFLDNDKPCFPLGVFLDTKYTETTIYWNYEDAFLLYTDGVTEAENMDKELYSDTRLLEFAKTHFSAEEDNEIFVRKFINDLHQDINKFANGNEQSDDITLLCFRLLPWVSFRNRLEDLEKLPQYMDVISKHYSIPEDKSMMITLALEELIVNIIQYGYDNGSEDTISLCVQNPNDGRLLFTLKDSAKEFNPLSVETVDTSASAEDREIGGLGIFLARNIFEDINYKYEDSQNIVKMFYRL